MAAVTVQQQEGQKLHYCRLIAVIIWYFTSVNTKYKKDNRKMNLPVNPRQYSYSSSYRKELIRKTLSVTLAHHIAQRKR